MNTRAFIVTLIGVIILGVGFGGSFIGGFAYGRTQEPAEPEPSFSMPAPQRGQQATAAQVEQIDPAQLERFRQAAQGAQAGQSTGAVGGLGAAVGSGRNTFGAVESVGEDSITVTTPQGTVTVTVSDSTTVQGFSDMPLSALQADANVLIAGERDDAGNVEASSIIVLPEGDQSAMFGVPGRNPQTGGEGRGAGAP